MLPPKLRSVLGLLIAGGVASAEGDDAFLDRWAATYRFTLGRPTAIVTITDGGGLLFLRSGPRSFVQDLWEFDVASGEERLLVAAEALSGGSEEQLTAEERARRERMRMAARGIASFQLASDGKQVLVPLGGELFLVERPGGTFRRLPSDGGTPVDPRLAPDGTQVACVREGDLYLIDVASGVQRRLTAGAGTDLTHGLAEFVAQEEMGRFRGFWWSPDSKRILYQETDTSTVERLTIADATRPERVPVRWPYPRPGKPNARVRLGLLEVGGWATTWVDWNADRYEYLAAVDWPEHGPLTITVQNRRQTEMALLRVDPVDGRTTPLLVEQDRAWVEIDPGMPRWLPDGSGFLWISERNGAPQLELRRPDGSPDRMLTETALGLRGLEFADFERRAVVVRGGPDPTESHLWRIGLDPAGGAPARLTREAGLHSVASTGGGPIFVVASALAAGGRSWEVWGVDASRERRLRSIAEDPGPVPNLEFVTIGAEPAFHAVVVRPRAMNPNERYPVINHVYGGPTSQMVQRDPDRYRLDQWIADQGYIVVSVDGRGTPGRGRDFSRAVKHDLIALPLEDQAAAMRLLARRFPEIDLTRVGIYGWSFGGYFSAMAVMRRPDVFHVGVAGAPVVSWEDYDTHYTERYMDLPDNNPAGYEGADVLTWADELRRPLLVIHGTDDDNVYFAHSLKLVDALFRAGRPFEFLPLSGFTHMVPDPLVTRRLYSRIVEQFDRHLKPEESGRTAPDPARPYSD